MTLPSIFIIGLIGSFMLLNLVLLVAAVLWAMEGLPSYALRLMPVLKRSSHHTRVVRNLNNMR